MHYIKIGCAFQLIGVVVAYYCYESLNESLLIAHQLGGESVEYIYKITMLWTSAFWIFMILLGSTFKVSVNMVSKKTDGSDT